MIVKEKAALSPILKELRSLREHSHVSASTATAIFLLSCLYIDHNKMINLIRTGSPYRPGHHQMCLYRHNMLLVRAYHKQSV